MNVYIAGQGKAVVHIRDLKTIADIDWVKNGLQIMIAIGTSTHYIET